MSTINNIYNVGDIVYFVEKNKIKNGEITAIMYRYTNLFNYIINTNLDILYSQEEIFTTPEKALENYIANCKTKEMYDIDKKYEKLEKEIYEDWCKKLN